MKPKKNKKKHPREVFTVVKSIMKRDKKLSRLSIGELEDRIQKILRSVNYYGREKENNDTLSC